MCGICGKLVLRDSSPPVSREQLESMAGVLYHRGPDSDGYYTNGSIGLGFRRLSIIDLFTGDQPMANEDESIWIIFNGEVYNFQELRPRLEAVGHRFRSRTDTETVIHAYEQYGVDCVQHLRGMFAFAIWDKGRRLFLARDRLGKKPVYYYHGGDTFVFASELKALLQAPEVPREIDAQAVDEYLTWGYIPAPRAILKGVHKLPPAHWLTVEADTGRLHIERYWEPAYIPKLTLSLDEAAEQLRELLTEAVRLRLISDVPLGALLSGGVDSSIVVGLMAELSDQSVKTFSIGFEEQSHNELPYARQVAQRFSTDHHEFIVRPNAAEVLPRLVWYLDEPMADSSALPTYYVAQMARQYVKVVLNGDGGDEAFAGYNSYAAVLAYQRYGALPRWLREGVIEAALCMLPANQSFDHPLQRVCRLVAHSKLKLPQQFACWGTVFDAPSRQALLTPEFAAQVPASEPLYVSENSLGTLDWMLRTDRLNYLPGDLLVKMDRMTMGHSLEARSPFLDHKVVESAARLPEEYKRRGRTAKFLLRHACADLLPPDVRRRPKQGFGVPIGRWFRRELRELAQEMLLGPQARQRGFFQVASIKSLLDNHQEGREEHSARLWSLLVLELWQRQFLDQALPEATVNTD